MSRKKCQNSTIVGARMKNQKCPKCNAKLSNAGQCPDCNYCRPTINERKLYQASMVILITVLALLPFFWPDIHKSINKAIFDLRLEGCFKNQAAIFAAFEKYKKAKADTNDTISSYDWDSIEELMSKGGFLKRSYKCPSGGTYRFEKDDFDNDILVCSFHGNKELPVSINGLCSLEHEGGTLNFDPRITFDQAKLLGAYLVLSGFYPTQKVAIKAQTVLDKIVISFATTKDSLKNTDYKEKLRLHIKEMSKEIFENKKVEFNLFIFNSKERIVIKDSESISE